jgi:hypothetical protein
MKPLASAYLSSDCDMLKAQVLVAKNMFDYQKPATSEVVPELAMDSL